MQLILLKMCKFVNIFEYLYNYCMKLSAKDLIKLLLSKENMTQKELASLITDKTGKKITQDGLSRKLNRDTITYHEVLTIVDTLGYDIYVEQRKKGV